MQSIACQHLGQYLWPQKMPKPYTPIMRGLAKLVLLINMVALKTLGWDGAFVHHLLKTS